MKMRRNYGESVFEHKCTRIKASLPLYDPMRIYGSLPGVVYTILRNISIRKTEQIFVLRDLIYRDASDRVRFIANVNIYSEENSPGHEISRISGDRSN